MYTCPECGDTSVWIQETIWVRYDEDSEQETGGRRSDQNSDASCNNCDYEGCRGDFGEREGITRTATPQPGNDQGP